MKSYFYAWELVVESNFVHTFEVGLMVGWATEFVAD